MELTKGKDPSGLWSKCDRCLVVRDAEGQVSGLVCQCKKEHPGCRKDRETHPHCSMACTYRCPCGGPLPHQTPPIKKEN